MIHHMKRKILLLAAILLICSCEKDDLSQSSTGTTDTDTTEMLCAPVYIDPSVPQYIAEAFRMRTSSESTAQEATITVSASSAGQSGKISVCPLPEECILLRACCGGSIYEIRKGDEENLPLSTQETPDWVNSQISGLVSWINSKLSETLLETSTDNLYSLLSNREMCQEYILDVPVGADNFVFSEVVWSSADKVSRHSRVQIIYDILPFYSYEMNDEDCRGDFYFVSMTVKAYNGPMYGVYSKHHGLVPTYAHIFYGKEITVKTGLSCNAELEKTPMPETSNGKTTVSSGFSWDANIKGQFGKYAGSKNLAGTVGASFNWESSTKQTVNDQEIKMSTLSSGEVDYTFQCKNTHKSDKTDKAVPPIARGDQIREASWCWRVPGTKDNDTATSFNMKISAEMRFGYMWRHTTWDCEGNEDSAKLGSADITITLDPPNRLRMGLVSFRSTNSNYIKNVKVLDSDGNAIASRETALAKDATAEFQLQEGIYSIEFEVYDGDTSELQGKYLIEDVQVETAETLIVPSSKGKKQ